MQATGNILDLIGNTPLLQLRSITGGSVFAKAEFLNPGGSIKDRVARWIIGQAERDGILGPGSVIIEATSGNTGIGVALVGRIKGYPVIIVMPEDMSEERKKIIVALGAQLALTPKEKSISGAVAEADRLMKVTPGAFRVGQFENPRNPEIHYKETAPEIWDAMDGRVDAFVSGIGSGGTLGGVGKFLKERNPDVHIVAVEPANSAVLLGHEPGLHVIQGIGDGFIPPVLDTSLIDDVITVTDDDAIETTRRLAREECILAGTSSGANVWASLQVCKRFGPDCRIATILPDRAERYFSTSLL
ncbi:MAG: cysteine synthase A [Candidatus Latescibacterota bacterium]